MDAKTFVMHRFGIFLVDYLSQTHSAAPVNLFLSKSIPIKDEPEKYVENAFRNSFHYDESQRSLYIRMERTEDIGQFSLIVVHAYAHIRAGQWSDLHPDFLREFYPSFRYFLLPIAFII